MPHAIDKFLLSQGGNGVRLCFLYRLVLWFFGGHGRMSVPRPAQVP